MSQLKIKDGNNWIDIPASGVGVPSGGTTGQILQKSSNTDYATEWATPHTFELLWTNSDITSRFAAQDLSIDLSSYSFFAVEFWMAHNRTENLGISIFRVYDGFFQKAEYLRDSNQNNFMYRKFTYTTSTKILSFQGGYYNGGAENSVVIPYHIYGVR